MGTADYAPAQLEQRYHRQSSKQGDVRPAYAHDKGRVIHSFAFRRLQNKTQVLAPDKGDFHRTRLTHSLEVAQIGEGIRDILWKNLSTSAMKNIPEWFPSGDLIITACYCHDLGHPPFGHAGEQALHDAISEHSANDKAAEEHGGFEANAHTLRIITRLEPYLTEDSRGGMNLTKRTLLAVLKYPISYARRSKKDKAKGVVKCYFQSEHCFVEWAASVFSAADRKRYLSTEECHPTLDATIMDLADEIAYSTHDLEDAVFLKRLSFADICEAKEKMIEELKDNDGDTKQLRQILTEERMKQLFYSDADRKRIISGLIHNFITNTRIQTRDQFDHPLLRYCVSLPRVQQVLLDNLRYVVGDKVIDSTERQLEDIRNKRIINEVFLAYHEHGEQTLPEYDAHFKEVEKSIGNNQAAKLRVITDHIAGMSDTSLTNKYKALF